VTILLERKGTRKQIGEEYKQRPNLSVHMKVAPVLWLHFVFEKRRRAFSERYLRATAGNPHYRLRWYSGYILDLVFRRMFSFSSTPSLL